MRASWNRWLSALRKMAIARLAFPRWASVGNRANKVKGHATEDMVAGGRARKEHKDGNETADVAADFDRLCVNLRGLLMPRWKKVIGGTLACCPGTGSCLLSQDSQGGSVLDSMIFGTRLLVLSRVAYTGSI